MNQLGELRPNLHRHFGQGRLPSALEFLNRQLYNPLPLRAPGQGPRGLRAKIHRENPGREADLHNLLGLKFKHPFQRGLFHRQIFIVIQKQKRNARSTSSPPKLTTNGMTCFFVTGSPWRSTHMREERTTDSGGQSSRPNFAPGLQNRDRLNEWYPHKEEHIDS